MPTELLSKWDLLIARTVDGDLLGVALVGNIKDSPMLLLKMGNSFSDGVSLVMGKDELLSFLQDISKAIRKL